MRKKIIIVALAIFLLVTVVIVLMLDRDPMTPFCVVVESDAGAETIVPWIDDEGNFYVFLPGYTKLESATYRLNTESEVIINSTEIYDHMVCRDVLFDTEYVIEYTIWGKRQNQKVFFMKSGGVATVFIDTETESLDFLHENKDHKESGFFALYTQGGAVNYAGAIETIKGRGNYSWTESDKKPYNITLAEEANLLEMGIGSKWVLLANSGDVSQIRNKMVYDFAKKIGLAYTPDCCWVDLYLNGEYRGLYLLSESIEIDSERVDISETEGAILTLETEDILEGTNDTYFVTNAGAVIEIRTPVSAENVLNVQKRIQYVEDALLSDDPDAWKTVIDVDSWVNKYLIDEVFGNLDAFIRSCNFYYDGTSDKLFAGPVWDYDMSAGNENEWILVQPKTFCAYRPARMVGYDTPWIYNLCQKDEFWDQAAETYRLVFLPELEKLIQTTICEYETQIYRAAEMDNIRWRDSKAQFADSVDILREFMKQRIEFLTDIWCEGKEYCVIQALQSSSGSYCYYVVYMGEMLQALPEFENTDTASFEGWYDERTGILFDITQPITEDIEIYAKWEDRPSDKFKQIMKLTPLGCIAIIGIGLVWIEFERMKKSR